MDELMYREVAMEPPAFGDLTLSPYDPKGDYGSQIAKNGLTIRIADRPVAKNVRRLYELSHASLPEGLAVYDAYDIWVIAHGIGVIRGEGNGSVQSIGYEVDLNAENVLTIDLLPERRFKPQLETSFQLEADLGVEGHAEIPAPARQILDLTRAIGGDACIRLSSDASVVGRVSLPVVTPLVQAVGKMGSRCQWQFDVDSKPILGDQIMLQTILVPFGMQSISYRVRARVLMQTDWVSFPVPKQTRWIDVTCPLT